MCRSFAPPRSHPIPFGPVALKERSMLSTVDAKLDGTDRTAATDSSSVHSDSSLRGCMKVKTHRESLVGSVGCSSHDREVRFDAVEIREYGIELGDHPATSAGPPLALGWGYDPEGTTVLDLDLYEFEREGSRRDREDLTIEPVVRSAMLLRAGFSLYDLKTAVNGVRKEQGRREASWRRRRLDPMLVAAETVKSGVKRIVPRKL